MVYDDDGEECAIVEFDGDAPAPSLPWDAAVRGIHGFYAALSRTVWERRERETDDVRGTPGASCEPRGCRGHR